MYAMVDIETTGGHAGFHKITEVAVVHHDGTSVTGVHQTLINPQREIPPFITALTGIHPDMLMHAPAFHEVADDLFQWLDGRIFVAHNAHFDFAFLKKEFEEAGYSWNPRRLCTVRLSRKIIPGLRSYSLGRLAEALGVTINNRHRAGGDAEATAQIFDKLLKRDAGGIIERTLSRNSGEMIWPPNLDKEEFEKLPSAPGVYYFHDARGKIIYVGKALNIKKRISGHFTGAATQWNRTHIRNEIHRITHELTGTELIALLHEAQEIQRLWPKYNLAQKEKREQWGIFSYSDQLGYIRLSLNQLTRGARPLLNFESKGDVWNTVWELVRSHQLCPKLCGLEKTSGPCHLHAPGECMGACDGKESAERYNARMTQAIRSLSEQEGSFVILDKGRKPGERSVIAVVNGKFAGFGFIHRNQKIKSLDEALKVITPGRDNQVIRNILQSFLLNPEGGKILEF